MEETVISFGDLGFFERLGTMFSDVAKQGDGQLLLVFLIGIVFGGIIQYTRVDKFEKIAGFSMLKDTTVPKMLFLAIGITSIVLYFTVEMHWASYHIKPVLLGGLILGGLMFGASVAIMGKCPGTGPVSIAEGRVDVLVGAIGGLLGGFVFTYFFEDLFKPLIGESQGNTTLLTIFQGHESTVVGIFGLMLILVAFLIPNLELHDKEEECDIK
jgi:hypothetical protein